MTEEIFLEPCFLRCRDDITAKVTIIYCLQGSTLCRMSSCPHPPTAQHVDRSRGTITCTICGEVVNDQQLELDPLFARGERPAAGRSALRALGHPRPLRTTVHVTPVSQRPSVEVARRNIYNIARQLEISGDMAEQATGIYKLAVSNNAIVGARISILCACLYAVCRREGTNHVIYDFADATKESPYDILKYMRYICEVTNTTLPSMDVSLFVYRFAEQLDLGDKTRDVALCALKILRSMRDDWIEYGRRPLGVVAAALVVACHVFQIPRSPEQLCGMVRLTAQTVHKRLCEFLATPTAALASIDDYKPTADTVPPAYCKGTASGFASVEDALRELASMYYELVAEAKQSTPATPERCERWRAFIVKHCEVNHVPLDEETCDLTKYTPKQQLVLLGLPHAVPCNTVVDVDAPKQEEPLTLPVKLPEEQSFVTTKVDPCHTDDAHTTMLPLAKQLEMFETYVKENVDVKDLHHQSSVSLDAPKDLMRSFDETIDPLLMEDWDMVRLAPLAVDTDVDLEAFIVRDNETRLLLERAAIEQYKGEWDRGAPRPTSDVVLLAMRRAGKKRRRQVFSEQSTMEAALSKVLRGKGAATVNLSQLDALIPGLSSDNGPASDNVSVDDDWY